MKFLSFIFILLQTATVCAAAKNEVIAAITYIEVKAGFEDKFKAEVSLIAEASRSRSGNIAWYVQQSKNKPTQFIFYTRWANEAALKKHLTTPPVDSYIERTKSMMAKPVEVIQYVPIDL